jgi:hypothetical protein
MKADDIKQAVESFNHSRRELDQEHRRVMDEVLESRKNVGEYELLYHVDNPERS